MRDGEINELTDDIRLEQETPNLTCDLCLQPVESEGWIKEVHEYITDCFGCDGRGLQELEYDDEGGELHQEITTCAECFGHKQQRYQLCNGCAHSLGLIYDPEIESYD